MTRTREPRLYVKCALGEGVQVPLDRGQAHYLRTVLRRGVGDGIRLFNGCDGEWQARLERLARDGGAATATRRLREQSAGPRLDLLFASLKRAPVDFLVEKATELGVAALQPVTTANTVVPRVNAARLSATAREAAEQCERLDLPELRLLRRLDGLASWWDPGKPLIVCAEAGAAAPILSVLAGLSSGPGGGGILVGPEGGLEKYELDVLNELPFVALASLGPRILRAETAALAAIACWQAALGDWERRPPDLV